MDSNYNISRRYTNPNSLSIKNTYFKSVRSKINFYKCPSDSCSEQPSKSECIFLMLKASISNVFDLRSSFLSRLCFRNSISLRFFFFPPSLDANRVTLSQLGLICILILLTLAGSHQPF